MAERHAAAGGRLGRRQQLELPPPIVVGLGNAAERHAREGVPLALSTLADQVGAGCAALEPLLRRVEAHVFTAERLHGDDTTVPVLAKGKTITGRCWVYVREDRKSVV